MKYFLIFAAIVSMKYETITVYVCANCKRRSVRRMLHMSNGSCIEIRKPDYREESGVRFCCHCGHAGICKKAEELYDVPAGVLCVWDDSKISRNFS